MVGGRGAAAGPCPIRLDSGLKDSPSQHAATDPKGKSEKSLSPDALQAWWSPTAPETSSSTLAWPTGWVRCAWCKKIEPYGSKDLVLVKRRRGSVMMHAKCAKDAELHDWGNAPPLHGGD